MRAIISSETGRSEFSSEVVVSEAGDERRFAAAPRNPGSDGSPRRIWDVEPGAVMVALGVLLDRAELELLFRDSGQAVSGAVREDALMLDAARQCTKPCAFAEACERLLDTRTGGARMDGCPMAELATLWLDSRNTASGRQLAALLWSLARDPRWVVGPLQDVVRGEIWVRALRLLGDRESPASVGPTPLAAGAQPA